MLAAKDFAAVSHCAEIAFHPSGRWLFAPNRALPATGCCSVAVFGVGAEGELSLSEICLLDPVPEGFSPQHISLDPSGDYCYIGKHGETLAPRIRRLESRLRFAKIPRYWYHLFMLAAGGHLQVTAGC